jgi:hypothetical protein
VDLLTKNRITSTKRRTAEMISRLLAVNGTKLISPKTYSAANGITNNPPNWFAARTSFTLAETMTFSSTLKRHARGAARSRKTPAFQFG